MNDKSIFKYWIKSHANKFYLRSFNFRVFKRFGLSKAFYSRERQRRSSHILDVHLLMQLNYEETTLETLWIRYYSKRMFNVLGTGWIEWNYNKEVLGFEGIILKNNICERYKTEIAWCRDMRSGYCFNDSQILGNYFAGLPKGADIKVAWEVSRMYHFPQLALLALNKREYYDAIIEEFMFQVKDFAKIPVGEGIHYSCAMEVAIRAINLILAFDIFAQIDGGRHIREKFEYDFLNLIWNHCMAILNNLEYDPRNEDSGNHYLADLCGLIFIASYMDCRYSKDILAFAAKEFLKEIDRQFLEDGANFECSTGYHRLACEISVLGVALLMARGIEIPEKIIIKLCDMRNFLYRIEKPNGKMLQIGDNDSGHVIIPVPKGRFINLEEIRKSNINWTEYKMEDKDFFLLDELSVKSAVSMAEALFDDHSYRDKESWLLVRALCKGKQLKVPKSQKNKKPVNGKKADGTFWKEMIYHADHHINFPEGYQIDLSNIWVSDKFGLIIAKKDDAMFCLRSVPNARRMRFGHSHNDIFHYELCFGPKEQYADQGSYVYTAYKEWRDLFRSEKFHNVPIHSKAWFHATGMFTADVAVKGSFYIDRDSITIIAEYDKIKHARKFVFYQSGMDIFDYSNSEFILSECINSTIHSIGYGMRCNEKTGND